MTDDDKYTDNDISSKSLKLSSREKAEKIIKERKCEVLNCTYFTHTNEIEELIHNLQVHQIELEMQNSELLITQENLRYSQKRFFDLYNMAPIGYCTISEDGFILEANLTALKLFGVTREELIKKPISNFIPIEDQDIYYLCKKKFFDAQEHSCELHMLKSDGTHFCAHISVAAEQNDNETTYIKLVISDITESKKVQEEIIKLNRNLKGEVAKQLEELRKKDILLMEQATLAQLGEMINMIAHQWRQPLNAISGAAIELSLLNMMGRANKEEISKNTRFVQGIVQRMSETIDDFMNFNKKTENTLFSLFDAVKKTYDIIEAQFKDNSIAVKIEIDKSLNIFHNKRAVEHSLINILVNSRDAFEENPNIKNKEIHIYTKEKGDAVLLFIEDNAGGIAEDIIGKIFNPYFTTKEQGKGTGLGLYMTKQMIEKVNNSTVFAECKDEKTIITMKFQKVT